MGRPTISFLAGLTGLLILVIAIGMLARSLPSYGLQFESQANGPLYVKTTGEDDPLQLVRITSPTTGVSIELTGSDDAVRRTERTINAGTIARQSQLATMAAAGKLRFTLRSQSGRMVELVRARRATALGWPFWSAAFAGIVGALSASWVLVLRPGDPSARAITLAGMALCLAAFPFAVLQNGELIVGGRLWRVLVTANWVGAHIFGTALIAYFTWFPAPLFTPAIRRTGMIVLAAGAVSIVPLSQANWFTYDSTGLLVSADFSLIVAVVAMQWRRSHSDPLGRAALRLVGSATVTTLALFLLITFVPPLLGASAEWADPLAFILMLPPFVAIAIGVTRGWMFNLDRWAWRLVVSAMSLLLIVGVDLLLLFATGMAPDIATTLAVIIGAALWIVLRQWLMERLSHRSGRDAAGLLAQSGEIALGTNEAERFERWRGALDRWFRPLSIEPSDHVGSARLEDAGVSMLVGAPPFGSPLRLYAASQGRSLFNSADTAMVDALLRLCEQTDAARQAYDRGMYEERERIARDLHDDVGGRLVTSLHRGSLDDTRGDVRGAIREMRQLLTGLRGGRRHVSELVALCRVDAQDRLEAAGIALVWPLQPAMPDYHVRYSVFRAVEATLREAITNVIRHARADQVDVEMRWTSHSGPMLSIDVADDGSGIPARCEEGRGLFNMRRRIGEIGGTFSIAADRGTRIAVRVPLDLHSPERGEADAR